MLPAPGDIPCCGNEPDNHAWLYYADRSLSIDSFSPAGVNHGYFECPTIPHYEEYGLTWWHWFGPASMYFPAVGYLEVQSVEVPTTTPAGPTTTPGPTTPPNPCDSTPTCDSANTTDGTYRAGKSLYRTDRLALLSAAVVTCLNVLLPCLADFEAGGPSKPAAVQTHLLPA